MDGLWTKHIKYIGHQIGPNHVKEMIGHFSSNFFKKTLPSRIHVENMVRSQRMLAAAAALNPSLKVPHPAMNMNDESCCAAPLRLDTAGAVNEVGRGEVTRLEEVNATADLEVIGPHAAQGGGIGGIVGSPGDATVPSAIRPPCQLDGQDSLIALAAAQHASRFVAAQAMAAGSCADKDGVESGRIAAAAIKGDPVAGARASPALGGIGERDASQMVSNQVQEVDAGAAAGSLCPVSLWGGTLSM